MIIDIIHIDEYRYEESDFFTAINRSIQMCLKFHHDDLPQDSTSEGKRSLDRLSLFLRKHIDTRRYQVHSSYR